VIVVLCELNPAVAQTLARLGVLDGAKSVDRYDDAIALAAANLEPPAMSTLR
jgi:hypothetical protein